MRKYRIYSKKNGEKINLESFEADNESEAIEKTKEYTEKYGKDIFWDYNDGVTVINDDGTKTEYGSIKEAINTERKTPLRFYERFYDYITGLWYRYDPIFNIKKGFERMFRGYDRSVSWDIGYSMFKLLKYAIPKFIENMHGCPDQYCIRGKMLLRGITREEAEKQYAETHSVKDDEIEIGMTLFKCDLANFLKDIKLMQYYGNFGIPEEGDEDIEFRVKIPYKECSEIPDYEKISKLYEETKKRVFDFLCENIDNLWD